MNRLKDLIRQLFIFLRIKDRSTFLSIIPTEGIGAELGVFQGEFSVELIKITNPKKIYLVDPWWKTIGEHYGAWADKHNNGKPLTTRLAYEQSKERINKINARNIAQFIIEDDILFLKSLPDASLDWVYIDSTHKYHHTKLELQELNRVIKPNGIITGHDWEPNPKHIHHGVYKAVNEFCQTQNWKIFKIDTLFYQWAIKRSL